MDDGPIDLKQYFCLLESGFLQKEDSMTSNMDLNRLDSCQEDKKNTNKSRITLLVESKDEVFLYLLKFI